MPTIILRTVKVPVLPKNTGIVLVRSDNEIFRYGSGIFLLGKNV
jgi:hypothetical protein